MDALTTIGGYFDARKGASVKVGNYVKDNIKAYEIISNLPKPKRNGWVTPDNKYIIADGICTEIVSHKANVYRVRKITQTEIEYLITDGNGNYAHGETLEDAKSDLIFKITDRRKSDYEGMNKDSVLSHNDAIVCYRVITGACSLGTKHFIKSFLGDKKQDKYSINDIYTLTVGQWGNESFKAFFKL